MRLSEKEVIISIITFTIAIITLTAGITWMIIEDKNNVSDLESFELEMPSKSELEIYINEFIEDNEIKEDMLEEKQENTTIWNSL
ncbi:hypothetical protein [Oceanobacillus sp. FSL H7-0719]|uniref:hypothetical protein n=1 Tax=Oceanobacillus sp. FSL H7-0719 TaxID=2954507 RepID=UPI00324FCF08